MEKYILKEIKKNLTQIDNAITRDPSKYFDSEFDQNMLSIIKGKNNLYRFSEYDTMLHAYKIMQIEKIKNNSDNELIFTCAHIKIHIINDLLPTLLFSNIDINNIIDNKLLDSKLIPYSIVNMTSIFFGAKVHRPIYKQFLRSGSLTNIINIL